MTVDLKTATDNRLVVFAGVEYVECTPLTILVAHNGSHIVDELVFPNDFGALYTMSKINELAETYGMNTPNLCELQTDDRELIRLAATTAGVHVRPKRKKDIELFTNRTLQTYVADGVIYDLYDIEPLKQRSKLHTWLIKGIRELISKLQGERK